ncbi:MAG: BtrH N-terminal domain-containing protein [Bacteroidales bacterium]|nr:BtrH N-terminal domain-containing protein [Bacteroidales bacterium]
MDIDFKHAQSAHCENGVTSNLLKHYNINLSEPMIFGIGSGLFFSYLPFLKVNHIPVTTFRPLPGVIFKRAAKRIGFKIKSKRFSDPKEAMDALDEKLEQGIPVGMLVGVYHLTYFPKPYRFHFNAHNLVVYGKKDGNYLISDPIMETYTTLTYKELQRVRYAKGVFAPKGHMYWAEKIPQQINLEKAIVEGIKKTAKDMLKIPIPLFGVKGIRYLASQVRKYPNKLGDRKAAQYLGQIVRSQEEIGTGGAGFRFMFAAFLQEASDILKMPKLHDLALEMTAIGDLWREFAVDTARIVKARTKINDPYQGVANMLLVIADREKKVYEDLRNLIK